MTVFLRNTPVMEAQQDTTTPSVTGSWGGISPAAWDLLVCVVSFGTGSTALPALSGLTGWTVAVQATVASQDATWVYTRVATGGDTAPTVSFTTGASAAATGLMVTLYDLTDSSGATPVLYTSGVVAGANTAQTPATALAVPYAGCLGLCGQTIIAGGSNTPTWATPSGWTQDGLTGLNSSTGQCAGAAYHLANPPSGSVLTPAMYQAPFSYGTCFVAVIAPPALTTEFSPPQTPPGFLSPAAFGFMRDQYPLSNDAPSLGPAPVLRGVNPANTGTSNYTSNFTVTVPVPSGIQAGDLILIWCSYATEGSLAIGASGSIPGYSSCPVVASQLSYAFQLVWKNADDTDVALSQSAGSLTLSVALSNSFVTVCSTLIFAYGNPNGGLVSFDGAIPLPNASTGVNIVANSVITANLNERVVWLGAVISASNGGAANTISPPPGFMQQGYAGVTKNPSAHNLAVLLADLWQIPIGKLTNTTGTSSGAGIGGVAFAIYCTQAASFMPPPAPPGFMSPAAMPFQPMAPQVINDVPNPPGSPYLVAVFSSALSGTTAAIRVQNPTNQGDAICVMFGLYGNSPPVNSVTDTQGNVYSINVNDVLSNYGFNAVSVNSKPLTAADTITVTWTAGGGYPNGIVLGCPAASLGSLSYLVPAVTSALRGSVTAYSVTSPVVINQPVLLIVALSDSSASAANLGLQNATGYGTWNVAATAFNTAVGYCMLAAWKIVPGVSLNQIIASMVQSAANPSGMRFTAFIPETRLAPIPPPPAPPGMLSPAAFPFPNGPYPQQAVNDVPFPAGSPYLVAVLTGQGAATTATIPVQNPTGRGDAIVVLIGSIANNTQPVSCTDTQGNIYSFTGVPASPFEGFHAIAVNPNPLTAADTITITWASSVDPLAVILGCPVASLGGLPYLVPAAFNTNRQAATTTFTVTSPAALSQPALLILTLTAGSNSAANLLLQNASGYGTWNVVSFAFNASDTQCMLAAWMIVPWLSVNQAVAAATAVTGASILRFTALIPETRFATQPGVTQNSAPSPPGLMSPGAWPVMPQLPATVNDVPFPPGSPYLVAVQADAYGTTTAIPVQNPTIQGDAICVSVSDLGSELVPLSCTDTQGNSYSAYTSMPLSNERTFQLIAVNPNPLTSADTITVTWAGGPSYGAAIVLGCPAASLGSAGYLVPFYYNSKTQAFAEVITSLAAFSQPVLLVLAVEAASASPGSGLLQNSSGYGAWNIVTTASNPSSTQSMIVAWRIIPRVSVNQVIASITATASLVFTVLIPETRFSPVGPHPDMPPGMMAPGAWQYQPLSPPEGAWSTKYTYTRVLPEALPASTHPAGAVTRATGKLARAASHPAGVITRGAGKGLGAAPHPAGKLARKSGKLIAAVPHPAGNLARKSGKLAAAVITVRSALARGRFKALAAAVHPAGVLLKSAGKRIAAVAHPAGSTVRHIAKRIPAAVRVAAKTAGHYALIFAARVRAAAVLLAFGPPHIFRAIASRLRWRGGSSRNQ